jgi:hypothetical protein
VPRAQRYQRLAELPTRAGVEEGVKVFRCSVKVSRCSGVKAKFDGKPLATPCGGAPRIAFQRQEGPGVRGRHQRGLPSRIILACCRAGKDAHQREQCFSGLLHIVGRLEDILAQQM